MCFSPTHAPLVLWEMIDTCWLQSRAYACSCERESVCVDLPHKISRPLNGRVLCHAPGFRRIESRQARIGFLSASPCGSIAGSRLRMATRGARPHRARSLARWVHSSSLSPFNSRACTTGSMGEGCPEEFTQRGCEHAAGTPAAQRLSVFAASCLRQTRGKIGQHPPRPPTQRQTARPILLLVTQYRRAQPQEFSCLYEYLGRCMCIGAKSHKRPSRHHASLQKLRSAGDAMVLRRNHITTQA